MGKRNCLTYHHRTVPKYERNHRHLHGRKEYHIPPLIPPIRGGTDGAQLSFMGLPCPNLGTGGHAYHGPYEHITVEGMNIAVDVGLKIIELFYK